ncbi:MAG: nitroreductase family protein [Xylanivirga thermophila]|uniref:nitroreductase family protein n=1 Tax=Xylanivirga thermophila TaxID=2496273 RepID=UPI0013EA8CA8|nr:nitroreductase family protein [Xylanivirga thermophila]
MSIDKTIKARRTIRKYKQERIDMKFLKDLVDVARLAPSAANRQPLEYIIVNKTDMLSKVFDTLKWAGYIKPFGTPEEGERPVAYIVVLINKDRAGSMAEHDVGASVQNILLSAWEKGIGSCWIGSVDRRALREILNIPDRYEIDCVIALGYAAQEAIEEDRDDTIRYYLDDQGVLHVPKRPLDNILHIDGFEDDKNDK